MIMTKSELIKKLKIHTLSFCNFGVFVSKTSSLPVDFRKKNRF